MGRVAVRQAVTETITAAAIDYVGTVFPARPVIAEEQDYSQTLSGMAVEQSAYGSSCLVVVNMPGRDKRMRRTLTGRGHVDDTNIHPIVLELFFASTSGEGIPAQQDYDSIVDALFVTIRNNPVMSAPDTVWSAGEYTAGVTHDQEQPYSSDDGLTILINGVIRFEAWEWIAGTNV